MPESLKEEDEKAGEIVLPTVIIPTHTGQVFERTVIPEPKEEG